MDGFEKRSAEVHTRRTWLFIAQFAAVAPIIIFVVRFLPSPGQYFLWSTLVVAATFALGQTWRRWPYVRRVDVRADAAGLHLDGRLALARKAIRTAHVHTRGATRVRLVRSARPVDIFVDNEQEGAALIAALRLDPSRSVVRYTMTDGTLRRMLLRTGVIVLVVVALCIASLSLLLWAGVAVAFACEALVLTLYAVLLMRQHLTLSVGADGVRVRRWFGGARFFRYTDMESIALDGSTVSLRLRHGTTLTMSKVAARATKLFGSDIRDEVEGLVARVSARIDTHRTHNEVSVRAALARGERPTAEWLRSLRLYADASASFRTPAIPADIFWGVVEDATAPATARVGAAVALHGKLDDAARARLRVAADGCAAPQLRVALEAASRTEDERALSAVLDSLYDDTDSPRRRAARE